MPYNPAGLFSLVASYFANPGTTIRTEQHNPVFEDVASGLSQVLLRDGRAPMTGPLNMNGFAINNVAAGSSPGSVATLAQAMPLGAMIDFAGDTAPSGWMLCYGQAISRSIYSQLFAIIGTKYGAGDGSTTFNLPKLNGRVTAGRDDMGGTAANILTPGNSGIPTNTLGAAGGQEVISLTAAQNGPHKHPAFIRDDGHDHTFAASYLGILNPGGGFSGGNNSNLSVQLIDLSPAFTGVRVRDAAGNLDTTDTSGAGAAHLNVQPTFITNKIIRVSYDG